MIQVFPSNGPGPSSVKADAGKTQRPSFACWLPMIPPSSLAGHEPSSDINNRPPRPSPAVITLYNCGHVHLITSYFASIPVSIASHFIYKSGRRRRGHMPTPSDNNPLAGASPHILCPPDDDRSSWRSAEMEDIHFSTTSAVSEIREELTPPPTSTQTPDPTGPPASHQQRDKQMDIDEETPGPEVLSPTSTVGDKQEDVELSALSSTGLASQPTGYDFSNLRVCT